MHEQFIRDFFVYLVGGMEVCLFACLLWKRGVRQNLGVFLYVGALLLLDAMGRSFMVWRYGFSSQEYAYYYWLSDVALALAAFLLVSAFFRRACVERPEMGKFIRLVLFFVFIIVVGISSLSLTRNYGSLSRFAFIIEFQQNLYFTCLVLNTLLYILLKQLGSLDEQLQLLVCGVGIQFAAPAASFAFLTLTSVGGYSRFLLLNIGPLCTAGMLAIWIYAVAGPVAAGVPAPSETARLAVEAVGTPPE